MQIDFSREQVNVLYQLIQRSQITGEAAKMVASIQNEIEKAIEKEQETPKK